MSVITISREYGSEGSYIAEKVAKTLGYHLADKKSIGRLLGQYGFIEFGEKYDASTGFWGRYDRQMTEMVTMLNRACMALARHGNMVILGRGSYAVLTGFADVLNVRIQAPLRLRIQRVLKRRGDADYAKAEAEVKENDHIRKSFVEGFYGVRWDAAEAFDLVIDTGKISPDTAVEWIVEAAKTLSGQMREGERTTGSIAEDATLVATVASVLECTTIHR